MIWKVVSAVLALIALAIGIPAWQHVRELPPPPPPALRAQFPAPDGVTLGSGAEPLDAAVSPDERDVAFVATRDGTTSLWIESLATGRARPLDGTEGASLPAWKRDGTALAYFAKGTLNVLTLANSTVAVLANAPSPGGVTWRDDGSVLFVGDSNVVRQVIGGTTSDVTVLASGDVSHAYPFVDDRGRLIYVAVRQDGSRVVRIVNGDQTTDLTETAGHALLFGGVLIHVRNDVLLAQRLNETSTRLIGRGTALATGVGYSDRGHGYFAASGGTALWSAAQPRASELAWFDLTGQRTGTATEPGDYWQVRLSPSGRDAAVTTLDPLLRTLDVMVVPLAAPGNARRVSLAIGPDTDPVWSPNGATVIYRSAQSGPGAILSRPAAASDVPEVAVLRKATDLTPSDWRGTTLLFHAVDERGKRAIVARALGQDREVAVTGGGFNSWDGRWSPDQRWLAFTSDESGQVEVYVQAWPSGTPRVRATFGGGQRPRWGRDGTLFFQRGDSVMHASIDGASTPPVVATPQTMLTAKGLRDFAVAPVGNRILAITERPGTGTPTAHLILNWASDVPVAQPVRPR